MATKTANISARIQHDIKHQAEAILTQMGLPRSVAIDMYYRQIIMHKGIPFPLTIPSTVPARDTLSEADFDMVMQTGYEQAKLDDSESLDDVFGALQDGI